MDRKNYVDLLERKESILDKLENGEKLTLHERNIVKTALEHVSSEISPVRAYYNFEDWLYKQVDKSVELKSAMAWGALSMLRRMDSVTWDEVRQMYGEFMNKQMGLR